MFGSVNSEVIKHLEFALQGVQGERGHKLEGVHNNPLLKEAELNIAVALEKLKKYSKEGVK